MNIVGKILVFVNLVFSLVIGYLVILVYTADVHSANAFDRQAELLRIAEANGKAYRDRFDAREKEVTEFQKAIRPTLVDLKVDAKEEDTLDQTTAKVKTALSTARAEVAARDARIKELADLYGTEKQKVAAAEASLAAGKIEVEARQKDVTQMRDVLAEKVKEVTDLTLKNTEYRQEKTRYELEARNFKEQALRLEGQVQDLYKQLVRAQATGAGGVGSGTSPTTTNPSAKNPPPGNIEGTILTADNSGLVKLSIGSDSGLMKGQTLEVYRLGSAPKYLGTVRITDVSNKEAVATPMKNVTGRLQAGDTVASRLTGS